MHWLQHLAPDGTPVLTSGGYPDTSTHAGNLGLITFDLTWPVTSVFSALIFWLAPRWLPRQRVEEHLSQNGAAVQHCRPPGATLRDMPTSRPRYTITETEEVARALALAAERWPDDRGHGGKLLLPALTEWTNRVRTDREQHRAAILATSGTALPGEFGAGYLDEVRQGWPE